MERLSSEPTGLLYAVEISVRYVDKQGTIKLYIKHLICR